MKRVPTNRFLLLVLLYLPVAVMGGVTTYGPILNVVSLLIIGTVAVFDSFLSRNRLGGITVQIPEVIRLSKDKEGNFPVILQNPSQKKIVIRIGFAFPSVVEPELESVFLVLPEEARHSRVFWVVKATRRGSYRLTHAYLETPSFVGLWNLRKRVPVQGEIRVYPNLQEERKRVAALFLNRGAWGIHHQRMVGQGREFEKLREYIPGDSYDQIHWKATAKRSRPVTKVFQIERTQEVYVIIDFSRLSSKEVSVFYGQEIKTENVLEQFLKASLILGTVAQQQGDLFGLITFSNRVRNFLRAGSGKTHYSVCRDALYMLHPHIVTPDFDDLFSFIRLRLRRRALLVVLTDLNDPILAESFTKSAELVARQHLVLVNMVRPVQARPLFSAPDVRTMDDLYERLAGHMFWHDLGELKTILHRHGITLTLMDHTGITAELVTQYLSVKQRQLL